jgi:hypothetical protein
MVVKWVYEGDKPFSVDFGSKENSPFHDCHFTQSDSWSGFVRRDVLPDEERTYKYTVRVGGQESDPGGRVDP